MLKEPKIQPEVYELHLNMLKNIILKASSSDEGQFLITTNEEGGDNVDTQEREIAQKVLTKYISEIAESLQVFCGIHLGELKKTMIIKTSYNKKKNTGIVKKATAHEIKNQTIKDLIYVMSEVAQYLPNGDAHNQSKFAWRV